MGFRALELFKRNKPVEFYEFERSDTIWRYTSADEDIAYLGNVFVSKPINRGRIVWSGELAQSNVLIKLPIGDPLISALTSFPIGALTRVTIFSMHRGADDTAPLITARYVNYRFRDAECELRFESELTTRHEQGLRRTGSPMCPHTLYDTRPFSCGVAKALYKVTFQPAAVVGATVFSSELATKPDGWFNGGLFEYLRPDGILENRAIDSHVGNVIALRAPIAGLVVGVTVAAYAGCDHSLQMCHDKFDNADDFGGFPFVPEFDPYDGNPIF